MSLMHAILGFLRRKPQTGYSLKNAHFDKSVAYFWPADQTQIYKTLDKSVELGLATSEVEIQSDRPNRKVYSISKKGKEELNRWLSKPLEPPAHRDPLLVQLFFSDSIDADVMIEVMTETKAKHAEELEILQAIKLPPVGKCSTREQLAARLTLELGLQSKQGYIQWIDQTIDAIQTFERKSSRASKKK